MRLHGSERQSEHHASANPDTTCRRLDVRQREFQHRRPSSARPARSPSGGAKPPIAADLGDLRVPRAIRRHDDPQRNGPSSGSGGVEIRADDRQTKIAKWCSSSRSGGVSFRALSQLHAAAGDADDGSSPCRGYRRVQPASVLRDRIDCPVTVKMSHANLADLRWPILSGRLPDPICHSK